MSDMPIQPTFEEAERILRAGLAEALRSVAAQYAIPLSWIYSHEGRPLIPANGSAFLLDCGQGPFLVTAAHVYNGYLQAKTSHSDTKSVVGETPIPLDRRLKALDRAHDVATFEITAEEIQSLRRFGKIPLTGSQKEWPPNPPVVDRGIFFVGFPGEQRQLAPYRGNSVVEVEFGAYTALASASSVSSTGISILFQHDRTFDVGLRYLSPTKESLGGCSGAPMLTFVEEKGVFSWRLGGIITEAGDGLAKGARADCLNRDGTINPHPDAAAYRRDRSAQGR
jgi:hypothetical protein